MFSEMRILLLRIVVNINTYVLILLCACLGHYMINVIGDE